MAFGVSSDSLLKGLPAFDDLAVPYESGLIDSGTDQEEEDWTDGEAGLEDPEQCIREVNDLMKVLELTAYDRFRPPELWTHEELHRCAKTEDIKFGPMVSPSVRDVVGVKVLVYTATASADEFESMSIKERSEKYFARACSITGEAVNGERNQPAVCAVDLATGREVSVVADCVFQKVEDALQKVSSADAVGRVAVIVTESRLAQGQDKNFQGQTLSEQLGLAGTAERMRMKREVCVQMMSGRKPSSGCKQRKGEIALEKLKPENMRSWRRRKVWLKAELRWLKSTTSPVGGMQRVVLTRWLLQCEDMEGKELQRRAV